MPVCEVLHASQAEVTQPHPCASWPIPGPSVGGHPTEVSGRCPRSLARNKNDFSPASASAAACACALATGQENLSDVAAGRSARDNRRSQTKRYPMSKKRPVYLRADPQGASISCECEIAHTSLVISPSKVQGGLWCQEGRTWRTIALHLGSRGSLRWR
jgi:hypothetical protein